METDDLGRQVSIPTEPARIASLAPSITEIIFAAGAGHRVVGVTTADDFPPSTALLPRFSALPVDFEAVISLEPDLVLASDQVNSPQDAATFAAVGLPVYFLGVRSLDDMLAGIRKTGTLLGTAVEAGRVADSLQTSLAELDALTSAISARPSVLFLIDDATLYTFGRGSYMQSLIALAGGISITESHAMAAPILSSEFVLTRKPDVIIGSFGEDYNPDSLLEHHPTWDIVPAVAHGRIYSVNGDYFVRPGPRLVAGAWKMAALLHPQLVPVP